MIYAIARGMDDMTRQHLFNLSGLGMEYFNIIQNLVMLGVSLSRVGFVKWFVNEWMNEWMNLKIL